MDLHSNWTGDSATRAGLTSFEGAFVGVCDGTRGMRRLLSCGGHSYESRWLVIGEELVREGTHVAMFQTNSLASMRLTTVSLLRSLQTVVERRKLVLWIG